MDPVRRQERGLEVDALVAKWVQQRTLSEAMKVFLAAEVAAQDEELWRREQLRNAVTNGYGFFPAMALELMSLHVRRLRHLDLAGEDGIPSTQTYPASSLERKRKARKR